MASPTRPHDAVVISSRCSFESADAFRAVERELRASQSEHAARDIRRRPTKFELPPSAGGTPSFVTSVKSPGRVALKAEAARTNDHTRAPYQPPSDFQHRAESAPASWKSPNEDFLAKFRLSGNQDLRRRTALDQEGFFADLGADLTSCGGTQFVKSDEPCGRSLSPQQRKALPLRPEFQPSMPHTTRKSSNVELRLETIVDQEGLLPALSEIRDHNYREELKTPDRASFRTAFKAASPLRPMGGSS